MSFDVLMVSVMLFVPALLIAMVGIAPPIERALDRRFPAKIQNPAPSGYRDRVRFDGSDLFTRNRMLAFLLSFGLAMTAVFLIAQIPKGVRLATLAGIYAVAFGIAGWRLIRAFLRKDWADALYFGVWTAVSAFIGWNYFGIAVTG